MDAMFQRGVKMQSFAASSQDRSHTMNTDRETLETRVTRPLGYSVDLVPGKRQNSYGNDHSLYRRRADTWTKTNVVTHINRVILNGRLAESRIIRLWRSQKSLDFPSFYLGVGGYQRASASVL
jgi:hypothetical protein